VLGLVGDRRPHDRNPGDRLGHVVLDPALQQAPVADDRAGAAPRGREPEGGGVARGAGAGCGGGSLDRPRHGHARERRHAEILAECAHHGIVRDQRTRLQHKKRVALPERDPLMAIELAGDLGLGDRLREVDAEHVELGELALVEGIVGTLVVSGAIAGVGNRSDRASDQQDQHAHQRRQAQGPS
jgi:hypothetical protein